MSEPKFSFIAVAYKGRDTGIDALETLYELSKHHEIKIGDAVVVYKTNKGKIKLHPKNDLTAKKGGLTGATAGLIIGMIMGGPILGAAVGAATGALAGNISGIDKEVKHLLEEKLKAEDSALCVLVKYAHWALVQEKMAQYHGHIVVSELKDADAAAFKQLAADEKINTAVAKELQGLTIYNMTEKLVSAGDDFYITNEKGEKVIHVDGKSLSIQNTLVFKDMDGEKLCEVREKAKNVKDTMEVEVKGHSIATIKKTMIYGLGEKYTIKLEDGAELNVDGSITDHEYRIERNGEPIAEVSKRWFSVADSYGIEIETGQNDILILATAAAIDIMSDNQ